MKQIAAFAFVAAIVGPGIAFAQSACDCVVPAPTDNSPIGSVVFANGVVQASTSEGVGNASPGTQLFVGSQVTTGAASAARITLGANCTLNLPALSEATMLIENGDICLRVSSAAAEPGVTVAGSNANLLPLLVLGGGAGAALAFGGGDDSASN